MTIKRIFLKKPNEPNINGVSFSTACVKDIHKQIQTKIEEGTFVGGDLGQDDLQFDMSKATHKIIGSELDEDNNLFVDVKFLTDIPDIEKLKLGIRGKTSNMIDGACHEIELVSIDLIPK